MLDHTGVAVVPGLAHVRLMTESAKPRQDEPPVEPSVPEDTAVPAALPKEIGGAQGPEPTRYGDWQHKGRVTDF